MYMITYNQQKLLMFMKRNGEISSKRGQNIYKSIKFYGGINTLVKAKLVKKKTCDNYTKKYTLTWDGHFLSDIIIDVWRIKNES